MVGIGLRERGLIFRFGAYEVDLVQQGLRRGGSVVPIEPQVFAALAYLVQNRDRRADGRVCAGILRFDVAAGRAA